MTDDDQVVEPGEPFKTFATKADFDEWKKVATEEVTKEATKDRRALNQFKRQAAVERQLISEGIPDAQVDAVARLVDPDAEDISGAIDRVRADLPQLFAPDQRQVGGGAGRNIDPSHMVPSDPEQLQEHLQKMDPAQKQQWFKDHREQIQAAQAKGQVKTNAPGSQLPETVTVHQQGKK